MSKYCGCELRLRWRQQQQRRRRRRATSCCYTHNKHTHVHSPYTRALPESDMITINRPVASIVAAADECIQFLITGRRNSGKQDATPSAGRFEIIHLVVTRFSGRIFQWGCRTGHPYDRTSTRRPDATTTTGGPRFDQKCTFFCPRNPSVSIISSKAYLSFFHQTRR